jgi:hypothetical protein
MTASVMVAIGIRKKRGEKRAARGCLAETVISTTDFRSAVTRYMGKTIIIKFPHCGKIRAKH